MKVWLNGAVLDADAACIAPGDRGFTLGDGLFETMQARDGVVLRLDAHLARLARSAAVIDLNLPAVDFPAALAATLAANGLASGVLRLTVTRGSGPRGVLPPAAPVPTVLITAAPLAAPAPPARLVIAQITRRNEFSPLSGIKSLNYLDNILARQEAAARGADDAVLLNTQGRVAETTIANLFVVCGGEMLTPPLGEGSLPGVMRAEVLRLGAVERALMPEDLVRAEEIFLTSSLGIRSVGEMEGRSLSDFATADAMRAKLG
ncbi:aminotransferase class IV [Aquabacter sp. CN5-332]|uniref:aminotransferase class IV n=1 Tax=Aquabacter sp. CN5-332 TaxID=3156608 RepID=UPI0032B5CA64